MASMVHHGGRRGLGSVDLRSAQLCAVSPPYVEKEIWCSFRDRGNPFTIIYLRLIAPLQRPNSMAKSGCGGFDRVRRLQTTPDDASDDCVCIRYPLAVKLSTESRHGAKTR